MNLNDIPECALETRIERQAREAQAWRDREQTKWEEKQLAGLTASLRREVVRILRIRQLPSLAEGNRWLLKIVARYKACGLPFNASDDEIGAAAERKAADFGKFLAELTVLRTASPAQLLTIQWGAWCVEQGLECNELQQALQAEREQGSTEVLRGLVERVCRKQGVQPPDALHLESLIARLSDAAWWIRALRTEVTRKLDELARELGMVSKRRGLYVSDASLERFQRRTRAQAAFLMAYEAVNEDGEIFTLADLAATGLSTPENRRNEVMTRVRGMEEQARERGDAAIFATITCPSRMHAAFEKSGDINPAFKGCTPSEAQAYLCKVGARIRSKLKRDQIEIYGLRVAEPHHDGTPHWHLLIFCHPSATEKVQSIITRYALADSPNEPGAREIRCEFKRIDWEQGTAVGYIAKYIAKNIDGFGLNEQEHGQNAQTAALRVRAWASTHRVRQFQFLGGAPVGVYRELRKIPPEALTSAHPLICEASAACHRNEESGARANYGALCKMNGGVTAPRNRQLIKLAKEESGLLGRYHEPMLPKPCGVFLAADRSSVVRSKRRVWEIKRRAPTPWTRLNNCTRVGGSDPVAGRLKLEICVPSAGTERLRPTEKGRGSDLLGLLNPENDISMSWRATTGGLRRETQHQNH